MYTCLRGIIRQRGENQRLIEATVGDRAVRTLVAENSYVFLVLSHPALDHEVGIDLATVEDMVYKLYPTVTVDQWLSSLGSTSLPTTDVIPKKTAAVVRYNNALVAGYNVQKIHPLSGDGNDQPDINLTDLRFTRADTDYKLFAEHALVTVNGLFHLSDGSARGVQVTDGGRSVRYANRNQIGIWSFLEVGKVKCYPITDEMIIPRAADTPLKHGFTINLPGEDLTKKAVLVSVGGVLHFLNHHFKVTGDHSVMMEWWKVDFFHLYFLIKDLIDLKDFNLLMPLPTNKPDYLDMDLAMTDEAIRAFMKLSQTFVITVEAENFYVNRHPLEATKLPGRFLTYTRPVYPLQLENGLVPEYIAIAEQGGTYVLAIEDNMVDRYHEDTRPAGDSTFYTGQRISQFPHYYGAGYLLEMGREILVTE